MPWAVRDIERTHLLFLTQWFIDDHTFVFLFLCLWFHVSERAEGQVKRASCQPARANKSELWCVDPMGCMMFKMEMFDCDYNSSERSGPPWDPGVDPEVNPLFNHTSAWCQVLFLINVGTVLPFFLMWVSFSEMTGDHFCSEAQLRGRADVKISGSINRKIMWIMNLIKIFKNIRCFTIYPNLLNLWFKLFLKQTRNFHFWKTNFCFSLSLSA